MTAARDETTARMVSAAMPARPNAAPPPLTRPDAPAFVAPLQRIRITSTLPHRDALAPRFRAHFGNLSGDEGRNADEAIGALVRCNAEAFGLPRATE